MIVSARTPGRKCDGRCGKTETDEMTTINRDNGNAQSRRPLDAESHRKAVLGAEIRVLVHALGPYRVLKREALEREVKAHNWRDGGFEQALEAAIEQQQVERLPFGFYRLPHPEPPDEMPDTERHASTAMSRLGCGPH